MFVTHIADIAGCRVAAPALFVALATFIKTVAAVVTQLVVFLAGAAVAAVMLLIAAAVGTFAAVITVVAFPVVIPPAAAIVTLYAIFIGGMYGHGKERQHKAHRIFQNGKCIYVLLVFLMLFVCMIGIKVHMIGLVRPRKCTKHQDETEEKTHDFPQFDFHQIPSFL